MNSKYKSIMKFGETINEDAAIVKENLIAVSDGAGGGGIFADRWSHYLVNNLPEYPITNYDSFDKWIDGIWEQFYNVCEEEAKKTGGLLLNKFYDEGSFATLVAAWRLPENKCRWISYGDSVVFCYNKKTKELHHSFTRLCDFNNPPHLINCKDPLEENGFRTGIFEIDKDSVIFATSDALAHYIIMTYDATNVYRDTQFEVDLGEDVNAKARNSNYSIGAFGFINKDFEKVVLRKLFSGLKNKSNLERHLKSLWEKQLLGLDDYTIAIMGDQK